MTNTSKHPIRRWRKKNGLTQTQMAKKLKVSLALISSIESGERLVTAVRAKEWEKKLLIPRELLAPHIFGD